jgi:hypothetical protein
MSNFQTMTPMVQGVPGTAPRVFAASTIDSLVTITASGYLNDLGDRVKANDVFWINYADTSTQPLGESSTLGQFRAVLSSSNLNLVAINIGLGAQVFNDIISDIATGQEVSIDGQVDESITTLTTSALRVGVRGAVNLIGGSSALVNGVRGHVTATGVLTSGVTMAGLEAVIDLANATNNGATIFSVLGNWDSGSTVDTDLSKSRGIGFINSSTDLINAQFYAFGDAVNAIELDATATPSYYVAAGTGSGSAGNTTHCAAQQVLKISVKGAAVYIPIFTQNT